MSGVGELNSFVPEFSPEFSSDVSSVESSDESATRNRAVCYDDGVGARMRANP